MGFIDALRISATGLSAQRLRMNITSANLANIHTTRTAEGGPYRRKDVVFAAGSPDTAFTDILTEQLEMNSGEVRVAEVIEDTRPFKTSYSPGHPDADPEGYVQFPNVDILEEMVNMISASRSYEANVTAANTAKQMAQRALEIGK